MKNGKIFGKYFQNIKQIQRTCLTSKRQLDYVTQVLSITLATEVAPPTCVSKSEARLDNRKSLTLHFPYMSIPKTIVSV